MKLFIFLVCFFKITLGHTPVYVDYFIIRQVGQGQWTTRVLNDRCEHYDFGGEISYYQKLKRKFISQCFRKNNILHLSHADWDHYAFLDLIINSSVKSCWGTLPTDELKRVQSSAPLCASELLTDFKILFYDSRGKDKNNRSTVIKTSHFLLPGDSSTKMEKQWTHRLNYFPVKYLVLGHHGSRTSSGIQLLKSLPHLKGAIASARFRKYQHPHTATISRLKKYNIPLLKTEDWGDIIIY